MKLSIHMIGKSRESWLQAAEAEYLKRLQPMAKIQLQVHKTELNCPDRDELKRREAQKMLSGLSGREVLIALDETGQSMNSRDFSGWLDEMMLQGQSAFRFVIGGADGLDEGVRSKSRLVLSLSAMTFTHQMVRLVLLEQIYRALMIRTGRPYHRD